MGDRAQRVRITHYDGRVSAKRSDGGIRNRERFSEKMKDYIQHASTTTFITVPFIMSVQGIYSPDTVDIIDGWFQLSKQRNALRRAIFAHSQVAMFQGILHGLDLLHAKSPSNTTTDTPHVRRVLLINRPNPDPITDVFHNADLSALSDDDLVHNELERQLPQPHPSTHPLP